MDRNELIARNDGLEELLGKYDKKIEEISAKLSEIGPKLTEKTNWDPQWKNNSVCKLRVNL